MGGDRSEQVGRNAVSSRPFLAENDDSSERISTVRAAILEGRPIPGPVNAVPLKREPGWYKDAIIYQVHVRAFSDSNGDGIGDFPGPGAETRLRARTGRECHLAHAVFSFPPARRRVRYFRLPIGPSQLRDIRGFQDVSVECSRPRHPRDHRVGRQPHIGSTSLVSGISQVLRTIQNETGMCGATPTRPIVELALSSSTPRCRTGHGIRSPSPTIGIASSATSRI